MALQPKLLQKLSQNLTMTPQLQQAIKLLQLGRLEYQEAIEQELLENPVLEELREDGGDERNSKEENFELANNEQSPESLEIIDFSSESSKDLLSGTPDADWEQYLEIFSEYRGSSNFGLEESEERPSSESRLSQGQSLEDYLVSQIRLLDFSDEEKTVALTMVGNLDPRGYLCVEYEEVAESAGCSLTLVETVAEQLTTLEPHGVFARNLKECLLIQLDRLGKVDALEGIIIKNYLDRLQDKRYDQIAKKENVALQDVYKAVQAIQKLEPYPGRPFFEDNTRYIVPDIYVQKVAGDFVVILNDDGLPRLRVSRYYQQLLKDGDGSSASGSATGGDGGNNNDDKNRAYLQERLKAATWLIKSIQQRQNTIRKVSESIVKFQRDFFNEGISRLKPLVLKEVADDIGMHESTVSRVTSNKFMHTPQGLFELKFFFTTGIRSGEGEVSSSAIKEKIRSLIAQEVPEDPISDQKIVEILKQGQVVIARRTVAKYREAMGIPASSQRKKVF